MTRDTQPPAICFVGANLADRQDKWQASDRRYLLRDSMARLGPERGTVATAEIIPVCRHRGQDPIPPFHRTSLEKTS